MHVPLFKQIIKAKNAGLTPDSKGKLQDWCLIGLQPPDLGISDAHCDTGLELSSTTGQASQVSLISLNGASCLYSYSCF